ncbi:MAG: hypothetical protein LRY63_02895 [Nitrincola sp.]|nr:hypothetical protein [Nitrincola sp.]
MKRTPDKSTGDSQTHHPLGQATQGIPSKTHTGTMMDANTNQRMTDLSLSRLNKANIAQGISSDSSINNIGFVVPIDPGLLNST